MEDVGVYVGRRGWKRGGGGIVGGWMGVGVCDGMLEELKCPRVLHSIRRETDSNITKFPA